MSTLMQSQQQINEEAFKQFVNEIAYSNLQSEQKSGKIINDVDQFLLQEREGIRQYYLENPNALNEQPRYLELVNNFNKVKQEEFKQLIEGVKLQNIAPSNDEFSNINLLPNLKGKSELIER